MKVWLNINRNGGLGNRLFSRAHIYAAARELGATVVDWGLADCAKYLPNLQCVGAIPIFPGGSTNETPKWARNLPPGNLTLAALKMFFPRTTSIVGPVVTQGWNRATRETIDLSGDEFQGAARSRQFLILNGFKMTCAEWVRRHVSDIRAKFSLPEAVLERWAFQQSNWHKTWSLTVAVHMRASDFRTAQGGRYYLSPAEYACLIKRIDGLDLDRTLFVIFSDESFNIPTNYASLKAAFKGLNWIHMHGDLVDDLGGISSCDRIIGPMSSTYSRWASFANDRPWAGVWRGDLDSDALPVRFQSTVIPWVA